MTVRSAPFVIPRRSAEKETWKITGGRGKHLPKRGYWGNFWTMEERRGLGRNLAMRESKLSLAQCVRNIPPSDAHAYPLDSCALWHRLTDNDRKLLLVRGHVTFPVYLSVSRVFRVQGTFASDYRATHIIWGTRG